VLGNYFANRALSHYFQYRTVWMGLHLADPTPAGDLTTEMSTGGYMRRKLGFGTPAARSIASTGSVVFSALVGAQVTHFGFWTNQVGQHLLAAQELDTPLVVTASAQVLIGPGDIVIQLA